jgi:hypothetical protein
MKAKIWTKPKLVVLFRGRTEEAVLQLCKSQNIRGPNYSNRCYWGSDQWGTACQTMAIS